MKHYAYYIYHDEGYYKDTAGKYDIIDNFGRRTLQWCINYLNECRASGSHPKEPVEIIKIKRWHCGRWEWVSVPVKHRDFSRCDRCSEKLRDCECYQQGGGYSGDTDDGY